ncbi:MAG: hypothetical protein LBB59_02495 [Campylobacteraceae bacterium]|jgi:CRISPR-associated protein Csm5|nr:hypothetical protein [Campylobacteraceae bacterium]
MKTYHLKLTALSPIHIGTGQDYEPTNYVMDIFRAKTHDESTKKYKMLFEFDEIEFYKSLNEDEKKEFKRLANNDSPCARFQIYRFIHEKHKSLARKLAFKKVAVIDDVYEKYQEDIGKAVNNEGKENRIFDQFMIARTYAVPSTHRLVLPGSSIKGSISTAYQEQLYKQNGRDYEAVKRQMLTPCNENLFKNFLISDANTNDKQASAIATVVNVKRNIERTGISNRLEVVLTSKSFDTVVKVKEPLKFGEIASSCNEHYLPIFRSMFNDKTDSNTLREINFGFVQQYKNYQPKSNQFLLRIGHHSGGRATSIDGMREIKIKTQKGYETRKEETTIWLYKGNNGKFLPLGWVLCEYKEIINENID